MARKADAIRAESVAVTAAVLAQTVERLVFANETRLVELSGRRVRRLKRKTDKMIVTDAERINDAAFRRLDWPHDREGRATAFTLHYPQRRVEEAATDWLQSNCREYATRSSSSGPDPVTGGFVGAVTGSGFLTGLAVYAAAGLVAAAAAPKDEIQRPTGAPVALGAALEALALEYSQLVDELGRIEQRLADMRPDATQAMRAFDATSGRHSGIRDATSVGEPMGDIATSHARRDTEARKREAVERARGIWNEG